MAKTDLLETLTPTLYIGLGGTGLETLKLIKHRNQQVYPKNLPLFEYLSIDSRDNSDIEPLEQTEKIALVHENAIQDAGAILKDLETLYPEISEWLPDVKKWEKFKDLARIVEGANQCRAIGRFLFHLSKDTIREQIKRKIENITSADALSIVNEWGLDIAVGSDIEIFVISSLCGGTGSGQFIDLAYLSRQAFRDRNVKVYGILGLPNLFTNVKPGTEAQNKANAYAALKELDYYMDNKDYDMIPSFGAPLGTAPFSNVYLISSPNETNVTLKSREEACKMVSTALFGLSASKTRVAYNEYYVNDSSKLGIKAPNRQGTEYITAYSSLGDASLRYPYKRVSHACALKRANLLCDIITAKQEDPQICENYIKQFLTEFGLRATDLSQTLYASLQHQLDRWHSNAENSLRGVKEGKLVSEIESQRNNLEASEISTIKKNIDGNANKHFLKQGQKELKEKIEIFFSGIINDYDDKGLSSAELTIAGILEDLNEFATKMDEEYQTAQHAVEQYEKSYSKNLNDLTTLADQHWFKDLFDFDKEKELEKYKNQSLGALRIKGKNQSIIYRTDAIKRIYSKIESILGDIKQNIRQNKNFLDEISEELSASFRKRKKIASRDGLEYSVLRKGGVDSILSDFDLLRKTAVYEDIKKLYQKIPLSEWHVKLPNKNDLISFILSFIEPEIENILGNYNIIDELNASKKFDSYIRTNLITPSSPFISIDNGTLRTGGGDHIFEKDILGVEDKDNIDKRILDNVGSAIPTSTKDMYSIVLVQTKHGFPLFSVGQMSEFKEECDHKRRTGDNPCYTLNDDLISDFREITPEAKEAVNVSKRAIHAFDLGNMVGFLKTKGKGSVYYFCEIKNDIESGFAIQGELGGGRLKTKQWLMAKENREYLERLEEKIKSYLLNLDGKSFDEFYENWKIFKTKAANWSKKKDGWKDSETGQPDYTIKDLDPQLIRDVLAAKGKL